MKTKKPLGFFLTISCTLRTRASRASLVMRRVRDSVASAKYNFRTSHSILLNTLDPATSVRNESFSFRLRQKLFSNPLLPCKNTISLICFASSGWFFKTVAIFVAGPIATIRIFCFLRAASNAIVASFSTPISLHFSYPV